MNLSHLPIVGFLFGILSLTGCAAESDDQEEEAMGSTESAISGSVCVDYRMAETKGTPIKLRAQPSASAAVVKVLGPSTKITFVTYRPTNGFYKVYVGPFHSRVEGWAFGRYLEVDCP